MTFKRVNCQWSQTLSSHGPHMYGMTYPSSYTLRAHRHRILPEQNISESKEVREPCFPTRPNVTFTPILWLAKFDTKDNS